MRARRPNLVLIGFMGTGKSSIGRRCAEVLRMPFRDSDIAVERRARKAVSAIFEEDGEPEFRRMETDAIRNLCARGPFVIATGGGAPMNPENARLLAENGIVILLTASPEVILERTSRRPTRPLLAGVSDPLARIQELLADRQPRYRAIASCAVDTSSLEQNQAVEQVLAAYSAREAGFSDNSHGVQPVESVSERAT